MIVILTEKPSVARDIARHVGAGQKHEGYFEGNGYQVTWAFGHLIALKEPEDYDPILKKWSLHTLPLLPEKFELKLLDDKGVKKQFGIIKKLLVYANEIICATDAGREGELIFRYILSMSQVKKPWKRLWLSSLTDDAMKKAFQNIKNGSEYDRLYAAAKCRNESDWIVGLNATRNYTVRYGKGHMLWSIGRVQTPVLAIVVNRDDEIRHFISQPFWELFTKYRNVNFKFKGDRFNTKDLAEGALNQVKGFPFIIDKVSAKKEQEHPPLLFDLTELQREMNRKFGMTAADTLQIAQTLYEQKFITYPRTDCRYLTSDMKPQIAKTLVQLQPLKGKEIEPLDLSQLPFTNRIVNDKKVTDHHAIIPTGKLPQALPLGSQRLYDAITTRLIAAFYPPCIKEITTIEGHANQTPFQAKGVRILSPGWTLLYPKKGNETQENEMVEEVQVLPLFEKGETGPHDPFITEGKTKPPAHFNENTLLGAMETAGKMIEDESLKDALKNKGIGTPATRASIIETLIKRKYIERRGKQLLANDLGRYLVAIVQDRNLKSPELTGEWELKLKQIEKGEYDACLFMNEIRQFAQQLIHESDIFKINSDIYGHCPQCKSLVIKGNKGYGCSKWKEGCKFVLWKQYKNIELTEAQIQTLLQKNILLQPMNGNILILSRQGTLQEIPVPSEERNYSSRRKK